MKPVWIAGFVALLISAAAGCSTGGAEEQAKPIAPLPPRSPSPQGPAPTTPPPAEADRCGASELQWLVGRPRTEIPVPVDPTRRRVVCSTCAMTMDYNPERQTIVFDTDTGIVKSVACN